MKDVIVHPGPQVEIIDSPIPHPGADQLVIKVVVSGSNPKDWKAPEWWKISANSGDDIAGIVHSVGENVFEFKPGDRVAAFHEMGTPGGSYAEYALAWQHTTFHIPKKTTFEDYREGNDAVVSGIKDALKGAKLSYAFDAVSEKGSYQNIIQVLDPHGNITLVLSGKEYKEIPKTVAQSLANVGSAHGDNKDFAYIYFRYMARGLHEGWFKGHPPEVVPGGLGGIQQALKNLKDGKASAVKYVFRIADTEGAKSASL